MGKLTGNIELYSNKDENEFMVSLKLYSDGTVCDFESFVYVPAFDSWISVDSGINMFEKQYMKSERIANSLIESYLMNQGLK